jgi:hypothetical protein
MRSAGGIATSPTTHESTGRLEARRARAALTVFPGSAGRTSSEPLSVARVPTLGRGPEGSDGSLWSPAFSMPASTEDQIEHAALLTWIDRAVGPEEGRAAWAEACAQIGVPTRDAYTRVEALAVLETLSYAPGDVGIAARFTRMRLDSHLLAARRRSRPSLTEMLPVPSPTSGAERNPGLVTARSTAVRAAGDIVDLAPFFSPAFTPAEANAALDGYARPRKLDPNALSRGDAALLLDVVASADGILGVVASFARVKFLLRYPA